MAGGGGGSGAVCFAFEGRKLEHVRMPMSLKKHFHFRGGRSLPASFLIFDGILLDTLQMDTFYRLIHLLKKMFRVSLAAVGKVPMP